MQIDWSKVAKDERQVLYRALKELVDTSQYTWETILDEALRYPYVFIESFLDNFRAGRIARQAPFTRGSRRSIRTLQET